MLTIFPNTNYDSFSTLADANTFLTNYVPLSQRTDWDALTDDADKEILLRQSTLLIKQRVSQLPSTLEDELKQACILLANHSIGVTMSDGDKSSNVKVKEITGVVKTEYFNPNKETNSFPDIVEQLLSIYDVAGDGVFTFNRG